MILHNDFHDYKWSRNMMTTFSQGGIIQSLTAFFLIEELLKLAGGDVTA